MLDFSKAGAKVLLFLTYANIKNLHNLLVFLSVHQFQSLMHKQLIFNNLR